MVNIQCGVLICNFDKQIHAAIRYMVLIQYENLLSELVRSIVKARGPLPLIVLALTETLYSSNILKPSSVIAVLEIVSLISELAMLT